MDKTPSSGERAKRATPLYRTPLPKTPSSSGRLLRSTSTSGPGSGSSARRRFLSRSNTTPARLNPFESTSSDLTMNIMSPSVFSVVESPSNQSESGQFWSLDQQAHLFPAEISDDSPWKQANATSILDQESENRTQEQIDLYFSQNHDIKTPEESQNLQKATSLRQMSSVDLGSPVLAECSSSRSSLGLEMNDPNSKQSQTTLSFPPVLPPELERMLSKYSAG